MDEEQLKEIALRIAHEIAMEAAEKLGCAEPDETGFDEDEAHFIGEFATRLLAEVSNKLEMAEACLAGDNALIAGLKSDIAELERQNDTLRKDAERYRLLRSATTEARNKFEHYAESALDVVIDAALAPKEKK